jgi:DNA-binding NarL/FixJ family response regulator
MSTSLAVAIFDDVLAARREMFNIPGLDVAVYAHADDVLAICADVAASPAVIFMDYAMGADHANGADAIRAVRAGGYGGRIVAMSSDPKANAEMVGAGADEALPQKAMLRSFLVALGKQESGGVGGTSG